LRLAVDNNGTAEPIVALETGLGVTPPGRFVRITRRQCASLTAWLNRAENRSQLAVRRESLGSPPRDYVRVYVRLAYRECLTDDVPIPGEPCRTEDETQQPSRVADSWRLRLSFTPPRQFEENAVRALVHWFRRIPIVEHPAATPAEVASALRAAVTGGGSPPAPVSGADAEQANELLFDDPPAGLTIAREDLCECLRAALLVWVTELRPIVQERFWRSQAGCGCEGDATGSPPSESHGPEEDLLIGELWVPITAPVSGAPALDASLPVQIHEESRPYLLHEAQVQ
jgi:hypothetical protein